MKLVNLKYFQLKQDLKGFKCMTVRLKTFKAIQTLEKER